MHHFSSASFISDCAIRQLALTKIDGGCSVWMFVHETACAKRGVSCTGLQFWNQGSAGESCDTTAYAQLSGAYYAEGLKGAAPAQCWDSGAKNTLSRVILQNWAKALLLWKKDVTAAATAEFLLFSGNVRFVKTYSCKTVWYVVAKNQTRFKWKTPVRKGNFNFAFISEKSPSLLNISVSSAIFYTFFNFIFLCCPC